MNAKTTFEDMAQSCSSFPGKLWDSWQTTLQNSLTTPGERLYTRPIEVSERLGSMFFQIQGEWIRICINTVRSGNNESTPFDEWADKTQHLVDGLSETQQKMWSAWFKALADLHPIHSLVPLSGGAQAIGDKSAGLQVWQEAMRNTLKLQEELWTSFLAPERGVAEELPRSGEPARQQPRKTAQAA